MESVEAMHGAEQRTGGRTAGAKAAPPLGERLSGVPWEGVRVSERPCVPESPGAEAPAVSARGKSKQHPEAAPGKRNVEAQPLGGGQIGALGGSGAVRGVAGGGVASEPFFNLGEPIALESFLLRHRLIPSVRLSSVEDAVPLAEALQRAGLPLLQIELTTSSAFRAISSVRAALAGFAVGAGGVLSPGQIKDAVEAGACFGAGPAMHPGLLAAARSAEFPFLPGAMTPSEIEVGIQAGFLCQCICPAAAVGGPAMVRALARPYRHTRLLLVPTGGLRVFDFQEYLAVPRVGAVAGGFLCERALIEAGMWEDIEAQALLCRRKAEAVLQACTADRRPGVVSSVETGEIYR
jgi:2-dehydro-3-deoxyphosphogluconate aldolase/(4S)-4-hydroxy-2-oxoglutarate aldolase